MDNRVMKKSVCFDDFQKLQKIHYNTNKYKFGSAPPIPFGHQERRIRIGIMRYASIKKQDRACVKDALNFREYAVWDNILEKAAFFAAFPDWTTELDEWMLLFLIRS